MQTGPPAIAEKPANDHSWLNSGRSLLVFMAGVSLTSMLVVRAVRAFSIGPLSSTGRYTVFSTALSLLPNDSNNTEDVLRYDRQTGSLLLVSLDRNNLSSGAGGSFSPVISADGNVVAFVSEATNLSFLDHNGQADVFVRDLAAGVTTLVSVNQSNDGGGNGRSFRPQISLDGAIVTFESKATDLVTLPDANGEATDVFVRDRQTDVTKLVSVNKAGTASGNRGSNLGALSASGDVVVFESSASDLTANDTNAIRDVFANEIRSGQTTLVSVNQAGTGGGNADSFAPTVNAVGDIVAFGSSASDLAPDDHNGENDIFARNLTSRTTQLVSVRWNRTASANGNSFGPQLSADGKVVAFNSTADDLVPNDGNGDADVFVRDLTAGVTTLASQNRAGTGSASGRSDGVTLSADGKVVAFVSRANDLTSNTVDGRPNLFERHLPTGAIQLASLSPSGDGVGNEPAFAHDPTLSGDGSVLMFWSLATNLVAESAGGSGVFLLDWSEPTLRQPLRLSIRRTTSNPGLPLDRSEIELCYPDDGHAMLECSRNLTTWIGLSSLTNLSVMTESAEGTSKIRLILRELAPSPLYFRVKAFTTEGTQ